VNEHGEQRLEPGHRLDRYELLCPIAQGGMASVWLARQHGKHGFEKLVAVKTILPLYAQDLRFQQMFLDEARIASGIEHPNVAQILDLGEENDVLYIAMEWVDGDSLSKLFRAAEKAGHRLPVSIVCRLVSDACAGLHAAHELHDKDGELLNVVHRDVSPQNVLVSTKGQAKLIDFGIAKARDRVAGDTSTGFLKGKILYMAPEQALGKPVDRRADVWAVGAVLYHMLAGVPPYEGANQLATLHLLTQEGPPPPLPAHVPPQVVEVVARALTKDHARRIATAEELQRMLEWAMNASGQTAIQPDVAAFVNKQLVDRVEARRKAMDLALEAAKQRARLQQMLKPSESDSGSGIGQAFRTRASVTPSDARIASMSSHDARDPTSSATLGSAAVVAPRQSVVPGKRLAIVGGVLGVCALVAAMAAGVAYERAGRTNGATAPTPPPPTQTATATFTARPTDIPKPPTATPPPTTTTIAEPPPTTMATMTATATVPATTQTARVPTTTIARPRPTGSSKATTSTKTVDDGF
jgi:serine/threonine protein kinase